MDGSYDHTEMRLVVGHVGTVVLASTWAMCMRRILRLFISFAPSSYVPCRITFKL